MYDCENGFLSWTGRNGTNRLKQTHRTGGSISSKPKPVRPSPMGLSWICRCTGQPPVSGNTSIAFLNRSRGLPGETSICLKRTSHTLLSVSRRLAGSGPPGWGSHTERLLLKTGEISSGCGLEGTMITTESSGANLLERGGTQRPDLPRGGLHLPDCDVHRAALPGAFIGRMLASDSQTSGRTEVRPCKRNSSGSETRIR